LRTGASVLASTIYSPVFLEIKALASAADGAGGVGRAGAAVSY